MKEENAYILGTDTEELHRLGVQHQVWASEAQQGWNIAKFTAGMTLLDLGCGPGFCTKELAFVIGATGKVIGVDRSSGFIHHLEQLAKLHQLPIEGICNDFNELQLTDNSLDGMYCRWALAWIPNPEEILQKVKKALKPGGKMVIQEYYDWSTHQTEPSFPGLDKAIAAALRSFKISEGEIDIGRQLPKMLEALDMNIISLRLMPKLAQPNNLVWQWPKTFYYSYFPRLVEAGLLSQNDLKEALSNLNALENSQNSTICCPLMIEVIAEKQ